MKKQFLLLLSVAAVSALAACNINVKPSSSSLAPADTSSESSSEEPSSSSDSSSESSSSSSSSSKEEDIGPVPETIETPDVEVEKSYPSSKEYNDNLLLNYASITLVAGSDNNNSVKLRGLPRPLQPANNLAFRSLDSAVATVDEEGNVVAAAAGETAIEVSDKNHSDVKALIPVTVFDNLVLPIPEVKGVHYTQKEIDAAQEGDPAYGKTTDDWKVEPVDEVPNDKAKIAEITDELSKNYNGVHYSKSEIEAAQEGDEAYGKTTDDWKLEPEANRVTEIIDHELREMSTYKNGVRQSYNVWDEYLIASKDEAYFRITETDGDIITEDGAMTFLDSEWIFNTNKFYDTYVFHTVHGVNTYYPVSTVNYMPENPEENNRFAPLYDILDNLFTSGHDIFADTITDATTKDLFDSSQGMATHNFTNVVKNCVGGFLDTDGNPSSKQDFYFDCVIDFSDSTADQDDETQFGIPYGTPVPTVQRMLYTIRGGKLTNFRIELVRDYVIDGDNYQKIYYIDHNYERITDENRASALYVPDAKDYTLVDYLFAI